MAIKVLAGAALYNDGRGNRVITAADGVVNLPASIEKRFVDSGVAAYVAPTAPEAEAEPTNETTDGEASLQVAPEGATEETAGDEAPEAEAVDYSAMKVSQLRSECKARGLKFTMNSTKPELIATLQADDAPPQVSPLEAR